MSDDLAALQRQMAASLALGEPPPEAMDPQRVERARRALIAKRRRVVADLLPRTAAALGGDFDRRFVEHATAYVPSGRLYHVDDAWAFAEAVRAGAGEKALAAAAHDDLLALRLHYQRSRRPDTERIRERRAHLLAWTAGPPRLLVWRGPGREGRVRRFRWRF